MIKKKSTVFGHRDYAVRFCTATHVRIEKKKKQANIKTAHELCTKYRSV